MLKLEQYDQISEYKVRIAPGGNFTFDTVDSSGTFTINGNLNVLGATTTVGSSELVVSDNTITVNSGETGAGVSLTTAGLIIDRGSLTDAQLLWNESLTTIDAGGNDTQPGAFSFVEANGNLVGIHVASIKADPNENLYLLGENGTGYISVTGTTDYEKQIFQYDAFTNLIIYNPSTPDRLAQPVDDDIIPNIRSVKDYVKSYLAFNYADRIAALQDSDTRVTAYDADDPAQAISKVEISVDGIINASFKTAFADIFDYQFSTGNFGTTNLNGDTRISANGTGSIITNFPVQFEKITDPLAPSDGVKLYSKSEADGGTGIFFINENSTNDELISRNKALLYSIIF